MTSAVAEFARMRFPNPRHKITAVEIAGGTGCSYQPSIFGRLPTNEGFKRCVLR